MPYKSLAKMSAEDLLHWIEKSINELKIIYNGEIHRITEYASYEIIGNKLTVFSLDTGKHIAEYEIKEV